jgi:hypothetical protein
MFKNERQDIALNLARHFRAMFWQSLHHARALRHAGGPATEIKASMQRCTESLQTENIAGFLCDPFELNAARRAIDYAENRKIFGPIG